MPFLSVVTRCFRRPAMLDENKKSLARQTCQDYEQLFLVDDKGRGIGAANRALQTAKPTGDYVMVLDDDDMLIDDEAVDILREATAQKPDLVIFKADVKHLGILPSAVSWGKRPLLGQIGSCCFISRQDVWNDHIVRFGVDEAGDYAYLHAVWLTQPKVFWLNRLLAGVQRVSRGRPE